MTTVLLAYDGSAPARAAVTGAAAALPDGTDAVVVSVAPGIDELTDAAATGRLALPAEVIRVASDRLRDEALADAQQVAEEGARLAREAGFGTVRHEARAEDGPLWAALKDAAGAAGADLIACGTHGHGVAVRAILGSVASGVVQHAELPVLVVPEHGTAGGGPLVVGWDGSEQAEHAITAAGRLMPGRSAIVAYVWRSRFRHSISVSALRHAPFDEVRDAVGELDGMVEQWAREDAGRAAALAREAGLDATPLPIESTGPPSTALLDAATEVDACAIAVGRRGRGAVASALLGSVSRSLLHGSDRPVLIA